MPAHQSRLENKHIFISLFLIKKKRTLLLKIFLWELHAIKVLDVSAATAVQSMKLNPVSFAKIQKQDQEDSFPQTTQAFKIVTLGLRMCSVAS